MSNTFVIAICTLGANSNLSRSLTELSAIKEQVEFEIDILVVVNHERLDFPVDPSVRVIFEPTRGYSSVRNAAVLNTPSGSNLIFIDDDEIPTLKWLESLVEKHLKFPHDIIFGPVYSQNVHNLVSYRKNFEDKFRALADESVVSQCGSGNMLIPNGLIESGLVHFDPFFNLSGGEDTDLCFRLRRFGIKIRYAKKALLIEIEPKERNDLEYLDSRFLREIVTYSLVIRRNSNLIACVRRFFILLIRITAYGAFSPFKRTAKHTTQAYWQSLQALVKGY
jgi:GT2 family glycosyltransferase